MGNINTLFSTNGITESERILHTPGDFAKKNLLYVQEVGKLKSLQQHKSQRENLVSFLFLGVLSGEGNMIIEGDEIAIQQGQCALIDCRNYYAHESSQNNPWELIWVHFSGKMAGAYYDLFRDINDQKTIFLPRDMSILSQMIQDLMLYQKEKDLESDLLSGNMLMQIINECLFSVMNFDKQNEIMLKKMCSEIREITNEKYQHSELLRSLSEKYSKSEEELDIYFQRAYGISLRDYILNRRFTSAKELLRFTIKPIKEIIEESGIKNDDLFRRLFYDSEGMSAEEYRMKWSQWIK